MNLQRLGAVVRMELGHHLRRPLFWFLVLITVLTVWGLSSGNVTISAGGSQVGGKKAWMTSEFAVGQTVIFLVFLCTSFFISVAAGMSIPSDDESRVGPVLHATPLTPGEYVWGKFLAVTVTYGVWLCGLLGTLMFFHHVAPSAASVDFIGPFVLPNYLRPALLFGVPLVLFLSGVAFAVGAVFRRPVLIYFLPVALFFLCGFFLWSWSPGWLDPRINRLLMVLDPAGFRWLLETWIKVDRGVDFYNTSPIGLDATLLLNRVLYLALGLLAVAWSQRHLARAMHGGSRSARPRAVPMPDTGTPSESLPVIEVTAPLSSLGMEVRAPGLLSGLATVAGAELRGLLRQPGLYLFTPLILLQTIENTLYQVGSFDTPLLATPGRFAVESMGQATLLVCLLLMFYTVESLEREHACGFAPIHDATPLRTASVLLGKGLANGVVGVAIMLAVGLAGVIAQLAQGRVPLNVGPYLLVWGLLLLPTFLLWSAFMLAARALTRGRFGAYGLGLGVLVLTGYLSLTQKMTWVFNWPLWSAVRWTDLGAFQLDRPVLVLNRLAALSLAVFFFALAVRFDPRRASDAVLTLGRLQPAGLWRGTLRLLPVAIVPLALVIALNVQVDRGHQGDAAKKRAKEYWQKNLATWKDAPQPALVDVDLDVELDPEGQAFTTRGTYTLINRHAFPLERYALTGGDHWEDVRWTVDDKDYAPEDRSWLYVFTPEQPLAPGATVRVGFQFHGHYPRGVSKNGGKQNEFILPAGVVLTSEGPSFAPVIGYQDTIGIDEKENKYEPKVYVGRWYDGVTEAAWGTGTPYTTTMRLTGPADYTLNGVGTRVSDEVKDGRRVSVWKSDFPVNFFNIVAGRWTEVRGEGTVIFHHPAHTYNVEEMKQGLEASRRYYSEWFHPYPWKELKLSEFPGLALYAQGFPTNITFSEDIGFLTKSDPRANAAFLVTAHEAAHQWWGNLLVPGKGPGGDILSEATSHYSMLKLMEQVKGTHVRMETAKRLEERYAKGRRVDGERPLVKNDGSREGDVTAKYDKGGWVFWMLEDLMGREACHKGIQAFIRKYQGNADHPVVEDFVEHMRAFAPDAAAYDAFVKQWFFEVNVPEYRLSEGTVTKEGAEWVTTVTLENVGTGRMPVEVAAVRGERFVEQKDKEATGAPAGQSPDYHDARARTVLGPKEKAQLTVRSDFEPERLVVDPDVRVLQLRREQAVLKL
ncbi:M1 family aminopeptidase [Vitiosangium sp. GDMCC 1.1324]|uniref:ABC transporter permease/M1 family aminopeptidase n=1 Tax=Vitiosangium sp. (strain GDMCC 1.1324) TaxID=2138576 RepID=UPI000D37519C|nr:M1 family aminopeptidase [Vitiosangium sp. GDMCC 1.1324]PTL83475.1 hypothetical protein DAT35_16035 [Vitiosangium sp. GDMCC 1.1324]